MFAAVRGSACSFVAGERDYKFSKLFLEIIFASNLTPSLDTHLHPDKHLSHEQKEQIHMFCEIWAEFCELADNLHHQL